MSELFPFSLEDFLRLFELREREGGAAVGSSSSSDTTIRRLGRVRDDIFASLQEVIVLGLP
jgi:hypothetical protein